MAKTNEDRLEDLRVNTSTILRAMREDPNDLLIGEIWTELYDVCNDFIQLDISILDGGELPGAWGASKLSKSKM
jgi:hypothetical protein